MVKLKYMNKLKYIFCLLLIVFFTACEENEGQDSTAPGVLVVDEITPTNGELGCASDAFCSLPDK